MTHKRRKIANGLKSREARREFISAEIDVTVPMQIYSMRKARKWTQKQLGDLAGMAQARISLIERPGTGDLNLSTLKAIAAAFDVGLMVRFVPLSHMVEVTSGISSADMAPPSYSEDARLREFEQGPLDSPAKFYVLPGGMTNTGSPRIAGHDSSQVA
jgi:transcriptional regulator with XRE-family HTH domain